MSAGALPKTTVPVTNKSPFTKELPDVTLPDVVNAPLSKTQPSVPPLPPIPGVRIIFPPFPEGSPPEPAENHYLPR
jgi:hypothetical protein